MLWRPAAKGMCFLIHSGTKTLSPTKPRSEIAHLASRFAPRLSSQMQRHQQQSSSSMAISTKGGSDPRGVSDARRMFGKFPSCLPWVHLISSHHSTLTALFAGRDRGENFQWSRSGRYAAVDDCGGQRQRRKGPLIGGFFR